MRTYAEGYSYTHRHTQRKKIVCMYSINAEIKLYTYTRRASAAVAAVAVHMLGKCKRTYEIK